MVTAPGQTGRTKHRRGPGPRRSLPATRLPWPRPLSWLFGGARREGMDLRLLNGKWFAVLMIAEAPGGEDEWAFFEGTATCDGKQLVIDRGAGNKPFPVPEDTLGRIKPVDQKLRHV